jgi:hypothetical protein
MRTQEREREREREREIIDTPARGWPTWTPSRPGWRKKGEEALEVEKVMLAPPERRT